MEVKVFCFYLLLACITSRASHVDTEPITELSCHANEGHDKVLDINNSVMVMLGGFHKEDMDDCILSCCNQEWKNLATEENEVQGRCNLATFYEHDDQSQINCFLVMCRTCKFEHAEGFQFAWVHPPANNYHQSHKLIAINQPNAISAIRNYILPLSQNLPSSQQQSQSSSVLPPKSEFHLSPWRLVKSAMSWYHQSPKTSAIRQRGRRQTGENVAEAPKTNIDEKEIAGSENREASPTPQTTPKQTTPTPERQSSEQATSKPGGQPSTTAKPTETSTTPKTDTIVITDNSVTIPQSKSPSTAEKTSVRPEATTPPVKSSTTTTEGQSTTAKTTATKSTEKETPSQTQQLTKEAETPSQSASGDTGTTKVSSTPKAEPATTPTTTPKVESTTTPTTPKVEPATTPTTPKVEPATTPTTPKAEPATTPTTPKAEPATTPTTPKVELVTTPTTPKQELTTKETTSEVESTTKKVTATSAAAPSTPSTPKKETDAAGNKSMTTAVNNEEQKTEEVYATTEMPKSNSDETVTTSDIPAEANKIFTFQSNNFILILSLALGIVLVVIVMVVLSRRWYEAYQRRHYNKVDYLINGS